MLTSPLTITHNRDTLTIQELPEGTQLSILNECEAVTSTITLPPVLLMALTNHLLAIINQNS